MSIAPPAKNQQAASKFVGFKRMSFAGYILADNNQCTGCRFDGGLTHRAIAEIAGEYHGQAELSAQLQEWLETTFGDDSVAGVDVTKWQFVDLQSRIRYWALCCHPEKYDAQRAFQALDEICWTLDRGDPQPGDKVIVWQSKGQRGRRGVIGLGEVIAKPAAMEETAAEREFWLDEAPMGAERRTRFRVLSLTGLPLWETDHPDLLPNLSVAKARGGTVFSLTENQWAQILDLAQRRSKTEPALLKQTASGQGYGLNAFERRAVEQYAQQRAERYFLSFQYDVKDVSKTSSYDLHCTRGDKILHVEVKGTTGTSPTFFLTRNEVDLAQRYPDRAALFFVRNIVLRYTERGPIAEGGNDTVLLPWNIGDGTLAPVQFEYRLGVE